MRLTTSQRFTSDTTWTAPAGITQVLIIPDGGVGSLISVVPNTSYSIISTTAPGSFGSLYSFKTTSSTGYFTVIWMDG